MYKILILGSSGMAGHVISRYLNSLSKYKIINVTENIKLDPNDVPVDLEDKNSINKIISGYNPDYIINCVRFLIRESEENPALAVYLNSFLPHYLEYLGKSENIKIIHLSTDCVFSGNKGKYKEDDVKDGEGYYARTKALGEIVNNKDLTVRTSFIGPDATDKGEELFHWFMMQRGVIQGFSRVFWTGVSTLELAKAIDFFIREGITGIYHLAPKTKISKFELLKLIKEIWKKDDVIINKDNENKADKSLINTREDINYPVKGYSEMFKELYEWMNNNMELYKNKYKFI